MQSVTLRALRGRPIVIVRAEEAWTPASESAADIEAIRAELRGLGAVLVVRSKGVAWCFRPDDDVEWCAEGGDLAALDQETGSAALVVLDADGSVRFCRTLGPRTELTSALVEALRAAGKALTADRTALLAMSRRDWLLASLVTSFAAVFLGACAAHEKAAPGIAAPQGPGAERPRPGEVEIVLHVNGRDRKLTVDPRVSLLDALRERLALPGTKKGCDHGQCGACTVLLDGRRVNSCLVLAVVAQGAKVTTIEGLAGADGTLHPVQAAFLAEDGFQCGYCTPGQIMSAVGLLAEGNRGETDADVREMMSGNVCRCGAYPNIVRAIQRARKAG